MMKLSEVSAKLDDELDINEVNEMDVNQAQTQETAQPQAQVQPAQAQPQKTPQQTQAQVQAVVQKVIASPQFTTIVKTAFNNVAVKNAISSILTPVVAEIMKGIK